MFRFRMARVAVLGAMLLSGLGIGNTPSAQAQSGERCFQETGYCISGRFRQYWEQNGGLAVFGFPLGSAQNEVNRDTGQTYLTQWFERNRFELHPENKAPYDVLLGRLGDDALRSANRDWKTEPRENARGDCLFFAETGRNVCDQANGLGFKTYWQTHGLEFDGKRGTSYQESLALFGLPLTAPREETNSSGDRVITQWFERARFEWHPDQPDPAYRVLLGLLGTELRGQTSVSLPTNAPWVHSGNAVIAATSGAPALPLATVTQHNPPYQAAAASNGKFVAYVENISASARQVVIVNLQTGQRRPFLAQPVGSDVFGLVFSDSSNQLAYTTVTSGEQTYSEVHIVDLATGTNKVVRTEKTSLVPVVETWNTSGLYARLVYYQSDAPIQGMVQIDPANGNTQNVIQGNNYGAAISPDGKRIAVVKGEFGGIDPGQSQLVIVDRATGRSTTIVPQGPYYIGNPQWSADGNKVVYARYSPQGSGAEGVYVLNADGTGEQFLRLDTGAFPGALYDFAWRGNGSVLLLTEDGPGKISLFEVPLSNFHPAQAKTLQTMNKAGDFIQQIVYVPR